MKTTTKFTVRWLICGMVADETDHDTLPMAQYQVHTWAKAAGHTITLTDHGERTSRWSYQVDHADAAFVIEEVSR